MVSHRKSKTTPLVAIVLALITFSCLYLRYNTRDRDTLHSRHGFEVNVENGVDLNLSEIDKTVEIVLSLLENHAIFSKEDLDKAIGYAPYYPIFVLKDTFPCSGSGVKCLGEFSTTPIIKSGSIVYSHVLPISKSAFGHELLHYFNYLIVGTVDEYHKQETLFRFGCTWKYPPPLNEMEDLRHVQLRTECEHASIEAIIEEKLSE